jgi:hypothetical protein
MSSDAIISICLTVTICVIVICLCINSCFYNKYFYGSSASDEKEPVDNSTSLFKTWSYTCTLPENSTAEERAKVLKDILTACSENGFTTSFSINGTPVSKEDIENLSLGEESNNASV